MLMAFGGEVKGQIKTYLKGQKTGKRVQTGALIGLGVGNAKISSPMQTEAWGCALGLQTNEFRFYYGNSGVLTDSPLEFAQLTAARSFGLAGLLGSGADVYIQFRNTANVTIAGGTPTYFKLKERPSNTGISLNVGGLLGVVELNSIKGTGYIGSTNYLLNTATLGGIFCPNPYNGQENPGALAGTSTTNLLIDKDGEWFAKVTPSTNYNSVRLDVAFPGGLTLANVSAEINVNVYNAFTQADGAICNSRPQFTSPGEATGVNLNTGVLGLALNTFLADPEKAINDSKTDYSSFTTGVANVGVASTISQTFYFDHLATGDDGVTIRLGLTQALIDLNLLGNGVKFKIYKNDTQIGDVQTLADNFLGLNLLDLISLDGGYKQADITIKPTVSNSFNKIIIEYNTGLLNANVLGDALRIYDVNLTAAKPTFTSPNSNDLQICSGQSAELKANSDVGTELLWYDSLSDETPKQTSANNISYFTPVLNNLTSAPVVSTYYVATKKCDQISSKVPIKVTVNPKPPHPNVNISSN